MIIGEYHCKGIVCTEGKVTIAILCYAIFFSYIYNNQVLKKMNMEMLN